ncbi:MAG: hypothetical protein ACI9VS_003309 [Candidatus Binatia bacterium]|jgi:hypothetical protein
MLRHYECLAKPNFADLMMNERKSISWFEPRGYHWPKARRELKFLLDLRMWLRIFGIVVLLILAAKAWITPLFPHLIFNWALCILVGLAFGPVMLATGALLSFIPPNVSVARRGITRQQGQGARFYPSSKINNLKLEVDAGWTLLRFEFKEKTIRLALGLKIQPNELLEFLKAQGLDVEDLRS